MAVSHRNCIYTTKFPSSSPNKNSFIANLTPRRIIIKDMGPEDTFECVFLLYYTRYKMALSGEYEDGSFLGCSNV